MLTTNTNSDGCVKEWDNEFGAELRAVVNKGWDDPFGITGAVGDSKMEGETG